MSELRAILTELRQKRRRHDNELMHVSEQRMYAPVEFTLETMVTGGTGKTTGAEIHTMFLRRADHLEEHALQIDDHIRNQFGVPRTQTHLIWAANQAARGSLHAALVGFTDADLDIRPLHPDGEWTLRQTLEHVVVVERYHALDARHALARYQAGEPHGELPQDELEIERPGASLSDLMAELDLAREESLADLTSLTNVELRAPSRWADIDIDVRFLLMRFGQHEREHTDQLHKLHAHCGRIQTEADRLLGLCWRAHGVLEGSLVGIPDELLDRELEDGKPIRSLLKHTGSAESYFKRMIANAI